MTGMVDQDQEHLRLLAIFHYVVGGIGALFSSFPIIHLAMGIAFLSGGFPGDEGEQMPRAFAWLFVLMPACFILIGWCVSACILLAGRKLQRRTSHTFCFLVACVECLFIPFGTILGVFSIIVLNRSPVKELFASNNAAKQT